MIIIKKPTTVVLSCALFLLAVQAGAAEKHASSKGTPTASVRFTLKNSSAEETYLRRVRVTMAAPEDCENPKAKVSKLVTVNPKSETLSTSKPLNLVADKEIVINLHYVDAAYATNRICAVSSKLTLKSGLEYSIEFDVSRDITKCSMSFSQVQSADTKIEQPFEVMPLFCPISADPLVSGEGRGVIYTVGPRQY